MAFDDGTTLRQEESEDTEFVRDAFEDTKRVLFMIGFAQKKSSAYTCYIHSLLMWSLMMAGLAIYQIYLVYPDMINIIAGINFYLSAAWIWFMLASRVLTDRSLMEMRRMIKCGIYHYDSEELDNNQKRLEKDVFVDMGKKWTAYTSVHLTAFISILVIAPVLEYLFYRDDPRHKDTVNPYIPHPFYLPFDTTSISGYVIAYIIDLLYWMYAILSAINSYKIVAFGLIHIKLQMKILNYSIRNIHKRALKMLSKKIDLNSLSLEFDDDVASNIFQECLFRCLRQNIRHHHAVLRFKHICQPFSGAMYLGFFTVLTILLLASLLYLLLQDMPLSSKLKYAMLYLCENCSGLVICVFGEEAMQESGNLFESLYSTPWFDYNKNFKQTLRIMMGYTREPIRFKAMLFEGSASIEQYGILNQATYTLMNLLVASG